MTADRLSGVFGSLLVRRFTVRQPEMYRVVEAVSIEKLTTLDRAALCELAQTAMDIEFDGVQGDFIQTGCGWGGAAIVIAHAKRRSRSFLVYDPFAVGPDAEKRTRRELKAHGADERMGVQLVPGPYEVTISADEPLALAHIDNSEYQTMRVLLERLAPRLASGGHLIIDDYKTQGGCRQAVDEYFRGKGGFQIIRKSRLHIIRN